MTGEQPEAEQQPLVAQFGSNLFVFKHPLNRFEREALMRFETWTRRERLAWRLRYAWARLWGRVES